jgi:hypothetical protein
MREGGSFGLALVTAGDTIRFAAVDDNAATLTVWTLPNPEPVRLFSLGLMGSMAR